MPGSPACSRSTPTRRRSPALSIRNGARGRVRGPLHGMPILLKDNIDTADRMTTTAGSLALEGSVPARDSTVARALREAGAVLLGKTNLSEWANFRARPSSSGWSGRGGQCRNPYALDRSPCGSSSGSGVAAAASFCAAAIGTETDGSIVCPSSQLRPGRHQAHGGTRQPRRHHPDLAQPGHRRADGAHGGGRRRGAVGAHGGRSPRCGHARALRRRRPRRLHGVPRRRRSARQAARHRAQVLRAFTPASIG